MRIVVSGGAGFVGSSIVRRLIAGGHHVLVVDDLSTGKVANLEGVACDFHHANVRKAYSSFDHADAIVHAAAYPDVSQNWVSRRERERQWDANATTVFEVLELVPRGCRFILLSTCSVYAGGGPVDSVYASGPIDECTLPRATSPYAASKLAAEALVSAYDHAERICGISLRLVNVVGPRYHHGHLADFVRGARVGHVHALDDGKKAKTFVHVEQVADTVLEHLTVQTRGAYNVFGAEWSWRDSVDVMRRLRPDLIWELTCEKRASGWIGDPESLIVRGTRGQAGSQYTIEHGVAQALESLGWMT